MTKKIYKNELSVGGCLVGFLGALLLFAFPVGTVFGVLLILFANTLGARSICGKCGNHVASESKLCPTCKEELSD